MTDPIRQKREKTDVPQVTTTPLYAILALGEHTPRAAQLLGALTTQRSAARHKHRTAEQEEHKSKGATGRRKGEREGGGREERPTISESEEQRTGARPSRIFAAANNWSGAHMQAGKAGRHARRLACGGALTGAHA
jgi:hypothetical protein